MHFKYLHNPRLFIFAISLFLLFITSCDRVTSKTKETINKGGETVGKTATEFFEGVSEGVDKTLQAEVSLSEELQATGLSTGKYTIEDDNAGGSDNLFILYIIFEKDFNSTVVAKVYDKKGVEIGRTKALVKGEAGNAGYFDFAFDKRTEIESRSKIKLE